MTENELDGSYCLEMSLFWGVLYDTECLLQHGMSHVKYLFYKLGISCLQILYAQSALCIWVWAMYSNLSKVQVCLWSKFSFVAVLCCGCSYEKPPFACLALYNTWRLMGAVWPFLDPQYGNVQHIICCDQYATCAFNFRFSNSTGFTTCGHISD